MKNYYNSKRTSWISSVKLLFAMFVMLFACQNISAQVDVTATIGTPATTYTTVKLAFDAINAGTHQGVIGLSLTANTTETASAILNSGTVAPAAYTRVDITATIPVIISGSIVGAIIKLNGADNVIIDGRIAGNGRNITVQNTSTTAATAAIWLASVAAGNGCTNNIVRNLELACGVTQNTATQSTFGIIMCGTTIGVGSNGIDNDNNTFTQNRIIRARYGIVTRGTTTDLNQNIIVTNNIIGPLAFGADEIGKVGIFMQADNLANVSGNTVQFVGGLFADTSAGTDRIGIAVGVDAWSTATLTLISSNYTIKNNIVHDIIDERTFSAVGILLATTNSGAATNDVVANNSIYNIRANATSPDQTIGIGIAGGHTATIANNSVSLTGDVDPSAAAAAPDQYGSGIRISNVSSANHANITLVNNSVYMDLSSSSTPSCRYYAISGNIAGYSFGTGSENYNNYYINAANTQTQTGGIGNASGSTLTTQFATLANWQTAYTAVQDANSIQANPLYTSNTSDLSISNSSPNFNTGLTIAAVTDDITGLARPSGASYDIGAYEFNTLSVNQFDLVNGFNAYPNPVSSILNIEYTSDLTGVKIFNVLGQQVLTKNVSATSTQIDMSALTNGTYLVKVEAGSVSKTIKVFKK